MRSVSGIRASGNPHLGNYLGAMKPQIELQQEFDELFYFIADLHAITTPIPKDQLHTSSLQIAALYLALGLDPEKAVLFAQNRIPEHAELCWILLTLARMGELERMT
ncbi:tryptophan--tRNA ligase, partial [Candidatus Berkelbacteria bacterium]|nr:tryptophan--tRNA ligase [Candidatus Berkelbacteria bacterium]